MDCRPFSDTHTKPHPKCLPASNTICLTPETPSCPRRLVVAPLPPPPLRKHPVLFLDMHACIHTAAQLSLKSSECIAPKRGTERDRSHLNRYLVCALFLSSVQHVGKPCSREECDYRIWLGTWEMTPLKSSTWRTRTSTRVLLPLNAQMHLCLPICTSASLRRPLGSSKVRLGCQSCACCSLLVNGSGCSCCSISWQLCTREACCCS